MFEFYAYLESENFLKRDVIKSLATYSMIWQNFVEVRN